MKTTKSVIFTLIITMITMTQLQAQTPSLVDFDAFLKLAQEVKPHREERLVTLDKFNEMSKQEDVIILDTRSKEMYDRKHVKGAIHLNFSDFTQQRLAEVIPSKDTKILIYCNNNFILNPVRLTSDPAFISKVAMPYERLTLESPAEKSDALTLALNIPTYINLYGYGYKNVYELSELITVSDARIQFEGTDVKAE